MLYLFILVSSLDSLWGKSFLDEDPNSLKSKKDWEMNNVVKKKQKKHKYVGRVLETPN